MKFDLTMAAASAGLGFRNERSKKRRHSYTSARAFAAKPVVSPPARTSSSLKRSGSFSESHKTSESDLRESGGGLFSSGRRSFTKFLRSRKKKKSSQSSLSSTHTSAVPTSSDLPQPQTTEDVLAEQKGEFVRVVATILHPQIIYKTLSITKHSTVFEVVVKLVSKYALSQEDQNSPDAFYLTEVKESEQGSYSRPLENNDRVYDIQSRWENGRECSFILCRKESFRIDDDPFLDSPLEAIVMSPSQDYFETGFTGVVDVDVPSEPTSPNSYSAKTSFFGGPSSSIFATDVPHSTILPVSPSELSTDEVFFASKQSSQMSAPGSSGVDVSRLMQQSVSEGIQGIMNRVITEGAQRDHTPSSSRQRRATEGDAQGRGAMVLRPLVCSPMDSAEKKFPEFVFTPQVSTSRPTSVGSGEAIQLNFEETDTPTKCKPPPTPLYRASSTLSSVRFTTDCVFNPRYSSHASLYPSFSRSTLYDTAMDMSHSLYDMLESQLNPPSDAQPSPPTQSKDLLKEHGKILRRHHTFHVRRDHLQLHLGEGNEESSSFHDHLIRRAARAIRQRHSASGSKLSESESVPRLSRAGSSSANASHHGSTLSIGSEVATDLDALRDVRGPSSGSEHCLPLLSSHVFHSRTDSDGVFEMRTRGIHRGSSGSNIQVTGLDSTHYRRYPRTTSDSFTAADRQELVQAAEDSRMYQSVEAISTRQSDGEEDEVLYTFQHNLRPITVLVRSKSSQGLPEEGEEAQHPPKKTEGEKDARNFSQRRSQTTNT